VWLRKKTFVMASQREQLVNFINRKVFDPILNANPDKYGDDERKDLQYVQDKTKKDKERFEKEYTSADDVKENYLNDVSSEPAQKVDRKLKELDLPSLPKYKDEFEELCDRLGV
jgi:hypothetical protein